MKLIRYKLGQLIEQTNQINTELLFGLKDVKGMTITKEIIPTRAKINRNELSKFLIVNPGEFIYNPRTHGKRIGLGFNDSNKPFIISWNNISFRVKPEMSDKINNYYLYMHFNRLEWDRQACFNSWGSSTEVFTWNELCDMNIDLPDILIQNKYVELYKSIINNQRMYENGLNDLKIVCDGYLEKIKKSNDFVPIGKFIKLIDNRNVNNNRYSFKGLSMENYFIDSIANEVGIDFSKYKIVKPNEFACVLMKVGRDCRLTVANNTSNENYMISPAYYTFELNDINHNYFMSYISRSEFERRAWFSCDTSLRGSLPWNEFCNLMIPSASPEQQKIISDIYDVIIYRNHINDNLKEIINDLCPLMIKGAIEEAKKGDDIKYE